MGKVDLSREELIGDEYRKQYLEDYILSKYREFIKINKLEMCEFYYSYIAYMINSLKNQTMSFREVLKLRHSKYQKATTSQKQMIHYFFQLAYDEFEIEAQKIQSANQSTIIDVIDYDESLEVCSNEYRKCLNLKYDLLQTMSKDYINLQQMEKQASEIQEKRKWLQNELIQLFNKNSSSVNLQNICEGFEECLTIEPIFTKKFAIQRKNGYLFKNHITLYTNESASVYISLLVDIGKILKVSKNFKDVVPIVQTNEEAIGKNINFMQPVEIAQVHDQILLDCLEQKKLNQQIKHYPIIIGKDSQGWAIAYHVKLNVCMIGDTSLGACGWIQQIKDENIYLVTSSLEDRFRILLLEQQFYTNLFSTYISYQDAKKIRLQNIIPMLKFLVEKGNPGQQYETIIIQPTSLKDANTELDFNNDKLFQKLQKQNLFLIKFSFYPINNKRVQFVDNQITQFRQLSDLQSKKEALKNFKLQIYQFMNSQNSQVNYQQVLNSLTFIPEDSKDKLQQAKNIFFQNIPEIQNINQQQGYHKQNSENSINNQTINQKTPCPLQNIIEESNIINSQQSPLQDNPKRKLSIELEYQTLNEQYKVYEQKQIINHENNKQNTLIQIGSNHSLISLPNKKNMIQSMSQVEQIIPLSSADNYHNLFSFDNSFISPRSSYRNALLNADTNRTTAQLKSDGQINSTFFENSQDQYFNKSNHLALPKIQNSKNQQQPKTKKYVSIKENVDAFTSNGKTENNHSQTNDCETSKSAYKNTNDGNNKFKEEKDKDGSVKTGKTSKSTAKQIQMISQYIYLFILFQNRTNIIVTIKSKNYSYGLRIINLIGMFCILIISGLNITSFFVKYNDQILQRLNFEKIFWCFQVKRYMSLMFGNSGIQTSTLMQYYKFANQQEAYGFYGQLLEEDKYLFLNLKNLTKELINGDSHQIHVFNQVNQFQINQTFPDSQSYQITMKSQNFTTSLTYKMIYYQQYAFYIFNNLDDKLHSNEVAAGLNYYSMFLALDEIYEGNRLNFIKQIDQSKLLTTVQLAVISVVTGGFSMLVIPIYIFCMKKKEDILKLFATIPADRIIFMMGVLSKYIEKQEQMQLINSKGKSSHQQSNNYLNNYLKQNQMAKASILKSSQFSSNQIILKKPIDNMKKKNISTTNSISKINIYLFLGIITCLCLTIFYPISNYIITYSSVSNFKDNLQFLNAFDYFLDNLASLISMKYGFTLTFKTSQYPDYSVDTYLQIANIYRQKTEALQQNLLTTFQQFEDYDGFNSDKYNNFLKPIFKGNICDVIFKTGSEYNKDDQFTYEQCLGLANGVYQKGLFVVIKKMLSIFGEFFEAAYTKDQIKFDKMQQNLQNSLSIINEYTFFTKTLFLSKTIHEFFQVIYRQYYNQVLFLQILLLSLQLVMIFLVAIIGWRRFYMILGKSFYKSKQLLDLIDINTLLGNPYIISYFKRIS